ncbi:uncharacterized protein LOC107834929 isoform X2 [Poecilia formosa]|uniref:uncharacterized protein LOC107834929 isoform X2 n=1 Tax=Poecilia formosa TaxID=48698 RepID=UPI0007BA6B7A|nr:PREDICTED: uncharacterized protein LOC107834929 isoform X2 [Poecilia formosa]
MVVQRNGGPMLEVNASTSQEVEVTEEPGPRAAATKMPREPAKRMADASPQAAPGSSCGFGDKEDAQGSDAENSSVEDRAEWAGESPLSNVGDVSQDLFLPSHSVPAEDSSISEDQDESLTSQYVSDIFEVGTLNTESLSSSVSQFSSLSSFLEADLSILFHSTYVSEPEQCLKFRYDIDGLVVELERATALFSPIHYLLLPNLQVHMLQDSYVFIKKHVDLSQCTPAGLTALKNRCGHTIGYVDGGYHLSIIYTPKCLKEPDSRLLKKNLFHIYACEMFCTTVKEFQKLLKALPRKDKSRPTMMKQVSSDTSRYHVLRQDLFFVLDLLDKAMANTGESHLFSAHLYLTRFGQKDRDTQLN